MPKQGPRKQQNQMNDLRHWAEMIGAEIAPIQPKERPDTSLLLRAALVAKDAGRLRELHYPAYRARWAEGRDVADPAIVRALLEGAGLDADAELARAQSPELAKRLAAERPPAARRGAVAEGAGLDADAALARAKSPELEKRLESESRAAVERGVFGVPTIFVG